MFDANLRELPNGTHFIADLEGCREESELSLFFKKGDKITGVKSLTDKNVAFINTGDKLTPSVKVVNCEEPLNFEEFVVFDRIIE